MANEINIVSSSFLKHQSSMIPFNYMEAKDIFFYFPLFPRNLQKLRQDESTDVNKSIIASNVKPLICFTLIQEQEKTYICIQVSNLCEKIFKTEPLDTFLTLEKQIKAVEALTKVFHVMEFTFSLKRQNLIQIIKLVIPTSFLESDFFKKAKSYSNQDLNALSKLIKNGTYIEILTTRDLTTEEVNKLVQYFSPAFEISPPTKVYSLTTQACGSELLNIAS